MQELRQQRDEFLGADTSREMRGVDGDAEARGHPLGRAGR